MESGNPSAPLRNSPALHYLRDASGRLLQVSGACQRFLGCPPEKVIGRELASWFVHNPHSLAAWKNLQSATARGECDLPVELELLAEDNLPLWVELRENPAVDPAETAGSSSLVVGIMVDITVRRMREAQVIEAQRLENLGLLAAGIAHDLNNILSPILIAGSLLEPLAKEEPHRRMVRVLQSSAERGSRIVRQILNFAHADDGGRGPIDLRLVLREFLLVVEETFPRMIRVDSRVPAETPQVNANPTQLHQLLLNLAVNARDAMPQGGTLTIGVETFTLTQPPAHTVVAANRVPWVRISISDTGVGIAPDQLDQIWTPFYTTKPAGLGTGLGLSTVRSLVTAHGGFIEVSSRAGEGTTFTVSLPTVSAPPEPPAPPVDLAEQTPPPGARILVVDDEPSVRDVIRETLGSRGYEVLLAADGVEALSVINFNPANVALVITDIHMPHMTGDVLVNVLRRIAPDLPVLAISGHPNAAEKWGSPNQARPDSSLSKPFSGRVLLHAVHALVKKRTEQTKPKPAPESDASA